MHSPKRPQDEAQRLRALRERMILDTPSEERFDRVTRLAQRVFEVPIALVSLVDEHRQWFKSRQGLDVCESSLGVSFCVHAIQDEEILEVNDASTDPRFSDNPVVTGELHIRFYAGAPLTTSDGYRVGTLCIIDTRPRELSASQRLTLRELADCVQDAINQQQDRELTTMLAASFDRQPQPVMPLVEQALADNRTYAEQFGVAYVLTSRRDVVRVDVDAQRFHQILTNLLSNAAKFSPEGGQVDISVSSVDDQVVRIAVRDRGAGIQAEFQDRIFQKFIQVDASDSRKRGGTGLGLAITRELVQRMGGSIGFESVQGKGSCFHVELPIWQEDQGNTAAL